MADEGPKFDDPSSPQPTVNLRRLAKIDTYEVLESDLDSIQHSGKLAERSLAFAASTGGALASAIFSWVGASALTPTSAAVYASSTIVLIVLCGYFAISYRVESRRERSKFESIRSRQATVVSVGRHIRPDSDGNIRILSNSGAAELSGGDMAAAQHDDED